MNHEDIIKLAREAGLLVIGTADGGNAVYTWPYGITDELVRFATLVAAAEREACAAICDRFQARDVGMQPAECAGAIRARGNT